MWGWVVIGTNAKMEPFWSGRSLAKVFIRLAVVGLLGVVLVGKSHTDTLRRISRIKETDIDFTTFLGSI